VLYVVTNWHVIENGNTTIRMKTRDGRNSILATDERAWTFHANGDDLAVIAVFFDPRDHSFFYISQSMFLTNEIVSEFNIGPGDDTFVVGRFINHEGRQKNLPTVRFGCIAQMANEPVRQASGFEQESFLVEARSIGGYSGSPVFTYIPPATVRDGVQDWVPEKILSFHGPWLLGVEWGQINDYTPVLHSTGRDVNPGEPLSTKVLVNTGMMAVVPAWKLLELLSDRRLDGNARRMVEYLNSLAAKPLATSN